MKFRIVAMALAGVWGLLSSRVHAKPLECEQTETYHLDNGLEVVLQEDHSLPLIAVASSVDIGFRHDPKGFSGLAHYVEHLLFRGDTPGTGVIPLYEQVGATGINAYTASDVTTYYATLPAGQLERALWIEARRFAVGVSVVSESDAEEEADVVRRELALRLRSSWRAASGAAARTLFSSNHPYHDLQSTEDSLEGLSLSNARWFHEQLYSMERTRLVIVGDFQTSEARALIDKYWSKLRAHAPQPSTQVARRTDLQHTLTSSSSVCRFQTEEVEAAPPRQLKVQVGYKAPSLSMKWSVPLGQDPKEMLRVLKFWSSEVTPLARAEGLVVDSGAYADERLLSSTVELGFTIAEGKNWRDVTKIVNAEFQQFPSRTVDESQWRSAAQSLELEQALEKPNFKDRALEMTKRHCSAVRCDASEPLTHERVLAVMKLLNPDQAMLVTSEFNFGTVRSGPQVEVVQ